MNNENFYENDNINTSSVIGFIELTSDGINGKRYYHNQHFTLEGDLNRTLGSDEGYIVAIVINSQIYSLYNDTTDATGFFQIDYTVSDSLNVYLDHNINVTVISDIGPNDFICTNEYTIQVNATSYFEVGTQEDKPYFAEESFDPNAFLRYD
ncbi:MAG: hypothetical protein EU547_01930, partial [Promethearchaeota archaeon]